MPRIRRRELYRPKQGQDAGHLSIDRELGLASTGGPSAPGCPPTISPDLEVSGKNYRVADFANSWRGHQDQVIDGYQEIHELMDLDWQLLIPVYLPWTFTGAKDQVKAMVSGKVPRNDLEWQIRHLIRGEGLLGQPADRYRGLESGS